MELYRVRRATEGRGYELILPKVAEPVGDIQRPPVGKGWLGTCKVANGRGEEFTLCVYGPTLKATGRALYLALRAIAKEET